MRISTIICTARDEILGLEELQKQDTEIIVIKETGKGLAWNRNKGIKKATGDVVAFLDDDAIPADNWIETIKSEMEKADVVYGHVVPVPKWKNQIERLLFREDMLPMFGCSCEMYDGLIGCNFAVKREVFEKIGDFKEELGRKKDEMIGGEDSEWFFRVEKQKILHQKSEKMVVYHHKELGFKKYLDYIFWQGRTEVRRKMFIYHIKGYLFSIVRSFFWSGFDLLKLLVYVVGGVRELKVKSNDNDE
jgi:glycosyltransferase involved in cell wall biosynthesis